MSNSEFDLAGELSEEAEAHRQAVIQPRHARMVEYQKASYVNGTYLHERFGDPYPYGNGIMERKSKPRDRESRILMLSHEYFFSCTIII